MAANDLSGERFGLLTATELTGTVRWGCRLWRCLCECGGETIAASNSLRSGTVRSCGCLLSKTAADKARKHDGFGTPTYRIWGGIIQRCVNPAATSYPRYGGAGVTVCDRWRSFPAFLEDMGERPPGLSIDRIKNERGYEPGNCRWATAKEQRANQRRSRPLTVSTQA